MVWQVNRLPWPTAWEQLFGRAGALHLEIGFGGGHYLVDLAARLPESNIAGVEISNPSIRRAAQKIKAQQLANVRLMYGDARSLLWGCCAPASLDGVYVNFPDPWPKASHVRRRLINDDFLHLLATRMKPGARLEIATDHPDYQPWIAEHMVRTIHFESTTGAVFVTEDLDRPRTKYERQALEAGVVCHYYKYQRNDIFAENLFPTPEEMPMPHTILNVPLNAADIRQDFAPSQGSYDGINVRLIEMYESTLQEGLLVEAYVQEEPQAQRVGLVLQPRGDDEWKVAAHELGFPRATEGIHAAVRHLSEWLVSLHPDAVWVLDNLKEL